MFKGSQTFKFMLYMRVIRELLPYFWVMGWKPMGATTNSTKNGLMLHFHYEVLTKFPH